jgi:hypothetical protein
MLPQAESTPGSGESVVVVDGASISVVLIILLLEIVQGNCSGQSKSRDV